MKRTRLILAAACTLLLIAYVAPALCWSNGGYSADPAVPDYGTHDWIAEHALSYLPAEEKQYLTSNLAAYLYGTELPDLPASQGGIGDTTKHHIYYTASGEIADDASAQRAQAMYTQAQSFLQTQNYTYAARAAGAMTHYIADLAVFGHVMGASTTWGTEVHHSDYESYVTDKTSSYSSSFDGYLSFDGSLTVLSAHDATVTLAYDTTFGGASHRNCTWMDANYGWSNPDFKSRCGESLNLAVNMVADALHSLYVETYPAQITPSPAPTDTPSPSTSPTATPAVPEFPVVQILLAAMAALLALTIASKKYVPKPR
ncbi:MAG: zinc dependent phospholipase C family protein [Candidatus Bathyarchaeota archaeon]|nr:zinc dependent phospholipase C family protein [Candidatus Bathyarchaeota archaeon]